MGFRIGWWGKYGGFAWGRRRGVRLYTMFGGRRPRRTGCLIPLVMLIASGGAVIAMAMSILLFP